jgi:hypothetical protein
MKRVLGKAWKRWLKFAEIVGNIQLTILLSLIYFLMVPMIALPFKVLADPFRHKRHRDTGWVQREQDSDIAESMKKQY